MGRHAWVEVAFEAEQFITAVEVFNFGDSVHDCDEFAILAYANSSYSSADWKTLPAVPVSAITIEARNGFESFAPMELAANRTEVAALIEAGAVAGKPPLYLLVTEPRELPVRMQDRIPVHLADDTVAAVPSVSATVTRGEYFTWQLAGFVPPGAARRVNVSLGFDGFAPHGIAPTCFNLGGVDPQGHRFTTPVSVEADRVRSLWVGAQIPVTLAPGTVIKASMVFGGGSTAMPSATTATVPITLRAGGRPAPTTEPEPSKMTRLRWLDSELYTRLRAGAPAHRDPLRRRRHACHPESRDRDRERLCPRRRSHHRGAPGEDRRDTAGLSARDPPCHGHRAAALAGPAGACGCRRHPAQPRAGRRMHGGSAEVHHQR